MQDHRGDVCPQRLQEIILLAKHPVDGVDHHLFQKRFIDRPVVAGVAGGFQAAAAPPDDGLAASVVPVDTPVKLATENDLCETVLAGVKRLIEKITVYDEKLVVEFKSGLTVEVEA